VPVREQGWDAAQGQVSGSTKEEDTHSDDGDRSCGGEMRPIRL
jgi:hypothetical protein